MGGIKRVLSQCYIRWWYILIFVTVGSQKFQFNRLFKELDRLVERNVLNGNELFAQIGYSTYLPKNYRFEKFLDRMRFLEAIENSDIVITHGGTGSIISSVKKGKKVIAVPRLKEYNEHVDNHQLDIVEQFSNLGLIYSVQNINMLSEAIKNVENSTYMKYQSNTENIINIVERFIKSMLF